MTLRKKDFRIVFILITIISNCVMMSCEVKNKHLATSYKLIDESILEEGDSRNEFKPLVLIHYPVLVEYSDSLVQRNFNNVIFEYITEMMDGFKEDIVKNSSNNDSVDIGSYIRVNYKVFRQSERLISLAFMLESEWHGPRPLLDIQTFNFDLKTKTFLHLNDILANKDAHSKLIEIANSSIEKNWESNECNILEDMEELRNFNVVKDSLLLSFDIREVDRHCGVVIVSIPCSEISGLLKKGSFASICN